MDKRSLVLYLSGLAAAGAVVGLAASCSDQPRIKCTAGHGPFAAVYTPTGADECGIKGEQVGVEAYNYPLMDKTNLDPNHGRLGMGPLELAGAIAALDQREMDDPMKGAAQAKDPNPLHLPHALGDWLTPEPTEGEFCTVKEPNDIEQDLKFVQGRAAYPDGGGALDPIPALNIKYHWTDVRFYNTPASPGTQLVANLSLTRTDGLPDGGAGTPCTSQYHVVGLWPAIDCTADPPPGGGMPPSPIDETKCSPEPDNTKNRPTGSGISPDLLTRCHPDLHLCVLVKEPPSFK